MHGSISCLIAFNLFDLSHRTRYLLNTTTKQQKKSFFAQVLAKDVEGTPLQQKKIRQISFGSISASTREKSRAGKEAEMQPAAPVEPGKQKGTLRFRCLKGLSGVSLMQNHHCGRT